MIRAFIAIEVSDAVRQSLGRLSARLRQSRLHASWVSPENMHLTLRFLGEIGENTVEEIHSRLRPVCAAFRSFVLEAVGVGAFPNARAPSVIWTGISFAETPLLDLQREIESCAREVGCRKESNRFHPHVTIARIKDRRDASGWYHLLQAERDWRGGAFNVREIVLFRSELTRSGAVYTRLAAFSLPTAGPLGEESTYHADGI